MKKDFENLLFDDYISAAARDFIESSKMHEYDYLEYSEHLSNVMRSEYYMSQIANHTTELGNLPKISLPENSNVPDEYKLLRDILYKRKSIRQFNSEGIDISDLSLLLKNSYFITSKGEFSTRSSPSGGGLYPIELYYISFNTKNLANGIFHYNIERECLEQLSLINDEIMKKIEHAFYSDQRIDIDFKTSSGIIVFAGFFNRVAFKYMDKGIRFSLIEAGAIMQNVYLNATSLSVGCCACGGYIDDRVDELLNFKSKDQTILNALVIGKI